MDVATSCIKSDSAWAPSAFAELDSPETLWCYLVHRPLDTPNASDGCSTLATQSHVMGCSTAGEIHGSEISDDSLVVAAVRFKKTSVRMAQAIARDPEDSYAAGTAIASQLNRPSLRAILVLSDGLHVNGSELVKGLNDSLGGAIVITGGLAGDGTHFKRTWVLRTAPLKAAMSPPSASMAITSTSDMARKGDGTSSDLNGWSPNHRACPL